MQRIATYHRVSTTDQDPELCRAELREAASRLGKLVLEVEETGSGANNDRPGLHQILDAAATAKIDHVIIWKIDRFGRSSLDLLTNVRRLTDSGCAFSAITQGLRINAGSDPVSRLLLTMLAGVAEFERETIRERSKAGVAKARAAGKHIGRPRSPTAPEPSRVQQLRADGLSWPQIADALDCSASAARRASARASQHPRSQHPSAPAH